MITYTALDHNHQPVQSQYETLDEALHQAAVDLVSGVTPAMMRDGEQHILVDVEGIVWLLERRELVRARTVGQ